MKHFYFLFILPLSASAFTLNNNFEATFDSKTVKVYVDPNTTCQNALDNETVYDLADMVKPAVNDFWNKVPTSSLELKAAGFGSGTDNINTGVLCPPTDDKCISDAGTNVIPPVNGIVIGCNDADENFASSNVLAVTVPNNFSGKKIKGAVILINNQSDSAFKRLSRADQISVIAHEIGHAIGLGHSKDNSALMYYRTVDLRKRLGQDDIDGVSYLYPVHVDGCGAFGGLFGGTIKKDDDNQNFPFWPMVISLVAMIGIFEGIKAVRNFRFPRSLRA